jgi:hypothetical protein
VALRARRRRRGAGAAGGRPALAAAGAALGLSLIAGRQVFDSVRSLPAWAIIGLLGLLLLATALALLLRCDDLGRAGSGLRSRWQTWR